MTSANRDGQLMELSKSLMGMFQDFYAERLAKFYVLHVNWFYKMMWTLAKPLLSAKTRNKTEILGNPSQLLRYIDAD
jgi:hypothetical protein